MSTTANTGAETYQGIKHLFEPLPTSPITCRYCELGPWASQHSNVPEPATTSDDSANLRNFRVQHVAPTEHNFEPRCHILADSDLGEVRVFDVPDPDESQRAIADRACRALNSHGALVDAAKAMRSAISFPMTNKEARAFDLLNAALALAEAGLSPKGDTARRG